uniref:NR LBD domain-containing protein n=1 Tax=Heterorhabditis bacteriophora TaxID=37862 RepID=A0A1I7XPN2_HETBA
MKKEAVQSERDRIRPSGACPIPDDPLLDSLLSAEATVRQLRSSVITRTADAHRQATTGDVTDRNFVSLLVHSRRILILMWRKIRHFSAQHLVMCAAFRSIHLNDAVWLTNETCLHKDSPKVPDVKSVYILRILCSLISLTFFFPLIFFLFYNFVYYSRVAARIVDHLTTPMRQLQMNEIEYVALKAIAFYDPYDTRQKVLESFERHVRHISPLRDMPRRFPNLLLLLPPMLAIARDLIEDVQLAKLFGLAAIDRLMQELMLPPDSSMEKSP